MRLTNWLIVICRTFLAAALAFILTNQSGAQGTSGQFFPFNFPNIEACNGELVDISGYVHPNFRATPDGNGGFHFHGHFNAIGEGVGKTTGTTYLWRDAINFGMNLGPGEVNTEHRSLILAAKGNDAETGQFFFEIRFVMNANGEIKMEIISGELRCH